MNNFRHIEDMKLTFFNKWSKSYVDFENGIKLRENADGFEDNCVWTSCVSFCHLGQEYMWSAVNVSKSGPKISDPTKRHDRQLNFFYINGKLA